MNTQDFISRSISLHGSKFDYSKSDYKNNRTNIVIGCPTHGYFSQTPTNHYYRDCPLCGRRRIADSNRSNVEKFIKKAKKIHGEKYNYSKTNYITSKTKVEIICPIHGKFLQFPFNHFKYGCIKCGIETTRKTQTKTIKDFILAANKKHAGKYRYSGDYTGAHKRIKIICPNHGIFEQSPNSHLQGRGCPKCKQGINHPRFGKPSPATGYYGKYKNNTFRSLAELFWMIDAERNNVEFLALDQEENRTHWQVAIIDKNGKNRTYCPDFFIKSENKIIDIKPLWRVPSEKWKLDQARSKYERSGFYFEIVDVSTISVDRKKAKKMWKNNEIFLFPASAKRMQK